MRELLKKAWLPVVAALSLCACSQSDELIEWPTSPEETEVTVSINAAPWHEQGPMAGAPAKETRAGGEMLTPITLIVAQDGSDDIAKKITLTDGTNFNVKLDNGTYDLIAVCGLDASVFQTQLSSYINIPAGTDFAVGSTKVTVANGTCTPSPVTITAERQMAWLDLTVTGVPENVASFKVYIKGIYENYALDGGWKVTLGGKDAYTPIPVTKDGAVYACSQIMMPCSSATGVTYVAEATTTGGVKTTLTYTSSKPLSAGVHLTQTLAYGDLMVVEGGINLGGWTEETDEGTLVVQPGDGGSGTGGGSGAGTGGAGSSGSLAPGKALPGYDEATVVSVDGNVVTFVANAPLSGDYTYFCGLSSKKNYPFPSAIPETRWFIPQASVAEDKDLAQMFLQLITTSSEARTRLGITLNSTDVMAYLDTTIKCCCMAFDFNNGQIVKVNDNATVLRCFVFGVKTLE